MQKDEVITILAELICNEMEDKKMMSTEKTVKNKKEDIKYE